MSQNNNTENNITNEAANLQTIVPSNISLISEIAGRDGNMFTQCLNFARPVRNLIFVVFGFIILASIAVFITGVIMFVKLTNKINNDWPFPRGSLKVSSTINNLRGN